MLSKRKLLKGTAISPGIIIGHTRIIAPGVMEIPELVIPSSHINNEINSLDKAIASTVEELTVLRDSAGKKMGGAVAKIFDAQLMIAGDIEFLKQVKGEIVNKKRNAGYIFQTLVQNTTLPLKNSTDTYMQQMAKDIEAVSSKVLTHLSGTERSGHRFAPNTILVSKFFSPGEILNYRQRKAIGFIVSEGGKNSHMALIARAMMLPTVMVENIWTKINNDCDIIVDGSEGLIIVNPSDEDLIEYQKRKKKQGPTTIKRIKKLTPFPPVTKDKQPVSIASNLSFPGPADDILADQNIPVGLYRTEFLYLANEYFPDEETQFEHYNNIAQKFSDTSVIFRTFDLGYDKLISQSYWPEEDNPALGWRGIRPMLEMTNIFKTQIRAILRASTLRNVKIMLPMICDLTEFLKAKKMISQVKFALRKEKIDFDHDIEIGIMVEIPSAAISADLIAQKVDFISIGTNDLTQYTLAADRLNSKVANLYNPLHPTVLKLIKMTVEACKKHGKPVAVCGEIAGDPIALPLFIGMGIDQLSMSPNKIFDICRLVKKIDSQLAKHFVNSVMASSTIKEVMEKLNTYNLTFDKQKTLTVGN